MVKHLTTNQLAERWATPANTLKNWRVRGDGPKYIRVGRKVVYSIDEIERFERANTFSSTSEE